MNDSVLAFLAFLPILVTGVFLVDLRRVDGRGGRRRIGVCDTSS